MALLAGIATHARAADGTAEPQKPGALHWDFESGTLEGWTVTAGKLGKQPAANDNDRWNGNFNKHGKYFIGTFEDGDKAMGDQATGEIRSPVFVADADIIGLRIGGGQDAGRTYVALCDAAGGKELLKAAGRDAEAMEDVLWDVSPFKARRLYLKVIDAATGPWGHINVDFVRAVGRDEFERIEREKREAAERARLATEAMRRQWQEANAAYRKTVFDPVPRPVYRGEALRNVWMPMGGIGAGGMSIGGDGVFRRWMVRDAKPTDEPGAFFAVRAKAGGGPATARILQAGGDGVGDVEFHGEFPVAWHRFADPALPVRVSMESFSPFIPLDEKNSGLPVAMFVLDVENPGSESTEVTLLGSLPDLVGGHPVSFKEAGYTGVAMAGKAGSLVLAARSDATALKPWTDRAWLRAALAGGDLPALESAGGPPAPGGPPAHAALAVTFTLKAGERRAVPFLWAWHLPGDARHSHAYEKWFADAPAVCRYVGQHYDRLAADTRLFHDTLFATTLPYYVPERLSSQCSTLFTRVVYWTRDDHVYGWEGLGCCSGSCTHVWNYEQTMAHLFPSLERRMRDIGLGPGQAADGGVFNRFGTADSPWGPEGNEKPAADGHASTMAKAYREWRLSSDDEWLKLRYPAVKRAMEYWIRTWDGEDEDGVARGVQFNTYDASLVGPNTFIGSQYLVALRAAEEMAGIVGDPEAAKRWRGLFERGSKAYATECWDDQYKYFVQRIPPGQRQADYGNACFVDQVLGQWWASVNGLGHVLPQPQVKASLAAIAKWNMIGDMSLYQYHYDQPRIFIWGQGKGLMVCVWPRHDYLPNPMLYREEVWTGCEYQAAASMIWEGLVPEGLAVVKAVHERYNDGLRSPWNEIECGDHYARALSSWSVLLASQGFSYVGPRGRIGFDPKLTPDDHKSFFAGAEGWGAFTQRRQERQQHNSLALAWGQLRVAELTLGLPPGAGMPEASVELAGAPVPATSRIVGGKLAVVFDPPLVVPAGTTLQVVTKW